MSMVRTRMNIAGVMERLLSAALTDPDESVRKAAEELLRAARATYQDRDPDRVARELRAEATRTMTTLGLDGMSPETLAAL